MGEGWKSTGWSLEGQDRETASRVRRLEGYQLEVWRAAEGVWNWDASLYEATGIAVARGVERSERKAKAAANRWARGHARPPLGRAS